MTHPPRPLHDQQDAASPTPPKVVILFVTLLLSLFPLAAAQAPAGAGLSGEAASVAEARGLAPEDVLAALKTYVPSGQLDDYVMFSSGGQSGQVLVTGLPSMRLLKVIGVFTPEPWQGWGYASGSKEILAAGSGDGVQLTWGDTHHPAISETAGDYDGQFLFVNDKANARVAVIDLRDFETKQIVKNPVANNDHGGAYVTPDTEWVIEGAQYSVPLGGEYASIDEYTEKYRGLVTFWKFDREAGRIDPAASFALELPPYWQDIADAGKLSSDGWVFLNSINTENATGGIEMGHLPLEVGASQNEFDYLHIVNLEKAAELVASGRAETINGFKVLPLEVAAAEGVLLFAPEPKSPHGVDVTPDGKFIAVAGKLSPYVTIYSFAKIQEAIAKGTTETDAYGVPVLAFDDVVEAQVEVGIGPLHTQFDDQGYGYTSLFIESAVTRWSLTDPAGGEAPWSLVAKQPVNYNPGHIATAEGDTVSPDGNYLVALNKWSVDRFVNVGPLLPQNLQLIDISQPGETMPGLYDMPIGVAEPHYAQIIKADKLNAWEVYPETGWDSRIQAVDPNAAMPGEERVERDGDSVHVWMTAARSRFNPERIEIKKGDRVTLHVTNIERARDAIHGFAIPDYNINVSLEPGEAETIEFTADREGVFTYYCSEFCSALHLEMAGYLMVSPN